MKDKKSKIKYTIGIDEVGRGPLAGPVAVCALALNKSLSLYVYRQAGIVHSLKLPLRDSKKLSSQQREKWFDWIKKNKIPYTVCLVSPKIIDKINISNAANLAAAKAFNKLIKNSRLRQACLPARQGFGGQVKLTTKNCRIFLDGGLFLNKNLLAKPYTLNPRTIIKGDEKIKAITLASIVAKVNRDKLMGKLSKKYPKYLFHKNKGYGTKAHFKSIRKFGSCSIHRKSFLKNL